MKDHKNIPMPMEPICNPPLPLAQAYIPNQPYVGLVPLEVGFRRGSMFPNLYQPYHREGKEYKEGTPCQ